MPLGGDDFTHIGTRRYSIMIPLSFMRRRHISIGFACAIVGLFVYFGLVDTEGSGTPQPTWNGANNATLGFGGIFVSTENTHILRVQALHKAAALVGLDLTVLVQTPKTEEDVQNYLPGDKLDNHVNSVKATLNSLNLLAQFIDTGYDTALFVEVDVNFSITIRSQMSSLADAFWTTPNKTSDPADPYKKTDWDVLWLGHLDIEFTEQTKITNYTASHAPPWAALELEGRQGLRSKQQLAYNVAPRSTYAWATTREHAQWLLKEFFLTRPQQFDVALHTLCRSLRQRCVAPIPELMHHHNDTGSKSMRRPGSAANVEALSWW